MITAYLAERLPLVVYLPLAAAIAIAAAGVRYDAAGLAIDALAALLLLAEFRLWDDLADRRADALTHPERVLVTVDSIRTFVRLCAGLAAVNVAFLVFRDGAGRSLAALMILHAALGAWYLRRNGRTLAGDQLLLAKYPAFVVVIAGSRLDTTPITIALAAAVIYVAASAYEAWHDPVSPLGAFLGGRS